MSAGDAGGSVRGEGQEEGEQPRWFLDEFDDPFSSRALFPAERAAIERGLADLKAGRVISLKELEAEMEDWDV